MSSNLTTMDERRALVKKRNTVVAVRTTRVTLTNLKTYMKTVYEDLSLQNTLFDYLGLDVIRMRDAILELGGEEAYDDITLIMYFIAKRGTNLRSDKKTTFFEGDFDLIKALISKYKIVTRSDNSDKKITLKPETVTFGRMQACFPEIMYAALSKVQKRVGREIADLDVNLCFSAAPSLITDALEFVNWFAWNITNDAVINKKRGPTKLNDLLNYALAAFNSHLYPTTTTGFHSFNSIADSAAQFTALSVPSGSTTTGGPALLNRTRKDIREELAKMFPQPTVSFSGAATDDTFNLFSFISKSIVDKKVPVTDNEALNKILKANKDKTIDEMIKAVTAAYNGDNTIGLARLKEDQS